MPDWQRLPQGVDLENLFPTKARSAAVKMGRAAMNCVVDAGGGLTRCEAQSEDPVGMGFGDAIMRLQSKFQVGLWTKDGRPTVGGHVRAPMRFEDEPAEPPKP